MTRRRLLLFILAFGASFNVGANTNVDGNSINCDRAALRSRIEANLVHLRSRSREDELLSRLVSDRIEPSWTRLLNKFSFHPKNSLVCGTSVEPSRAPEWREYSELYLQTRTLWREVLEDVPLLRKEMGRDQDSICLVRKSIESNDRVLSIYEEGCRIRPRMIACRTPSSTSIRESRSELETRLETNEMRFVHKWGNDALMRINCR